MSDDLIAALQKELQGADDRILHLETLRKKDLDFYLWDKKQMSRRIALLTFWMKKLIKYTKSPDAKRNQYTMTTEIPDWLIEEGMDYLNRDTPDSEKKD